MRKRERDRGNFDHIMYRHYDPSYWLYGIFIRDMKEPRKIIYVRRVVDSFVLSEDQLSRISLPGGGGGNVDREKKQNPTATIKKQKLNKQV